MGNFDDVYYVSMAQAMAWMQDPQTLDTINSFEPWKCNQANHQLTCTEGKSCRLGLNPDLEAANGGGTRYMVTCSACPTVYPWLWDAKGRGALPDKYEKEFLSRPVATPADPNAILNDPNIVL